MLGVPKGFKYCDHCNGYGSSLKDPIGVDRCTRCGGNGLQAMTTAEKIQSAYDNGECPDCGDKIPDDMVNGGECQNCGHFFYEETQCDPG